MYLNASEWWMATPASGLHTCFVSRSTYDWKYVHNRHFDRLCLIACQWWRWKPHKWKKPLVAVTSEHQMKHDLHYGSRELVSSTDVTIFNTSNWFYSLKKFYIHISHNSFRNINTLHANMSLMEIIINKKFQRAVIHF